MGGDGGDGEEYREDDWDFLSPMLDPDCRVAPRADAAEGRNSSGEGAGSAGGEGGGVRGEAR